MGEMRQTVEDILVERARGRIVTLPGPMPKEMGEEIAHYLAQRDTLLAEIAALRQRVAEVEGHAEGSARLIERVTHALGHYEGDVDVVRAVANLKDSLNHAVDQWRTFEAQNEGWRQHVERLLTQNAEQERERDEIAASLGYPPGIAAPCNVIAHAVSTLVPNFQDAFKRAAQAEAQVAGLREGLELAQRALGYVGCEDSWRGKPCKHVDCPEARIALRHIRALLTPAAEGGTE